MSDKIINTDNFGVQTFFSENYDLKLALSLSKTESEAKKQATNSVHMFEHILPPYDAFEIIKDRLNLFYR